MPCERLVLQTDPHALCDDVLITITRDKRIQSQFRVRHQLIASNNVNKPLWLFVDVEFLGAVWARSVKNPKPHRASADRKTWHEPPIWLTSKQS